MAIFGLILFIATLACLGLVYYNIRTWPRIRRIPPPSATRFEDGKLVASDEPSARVSVIIPARNEEQNLPPLLESLMQQGPEVGEVLVLNDNSTDKTADVVLRYARFDSRIKLINGKPLPEGWFGKTWAGYQLAQVAKCDWIMSMDADTRLEPGAVNSILAAARKYRVTYLSCWPKFELISPAEKVFLPMLNFVTFTTFLWKWMFWYMHDSRAIISSGACMLMHRNAYDKVGGHANSSIRNGLLEDHALARNWRRHGERSLTLDGHDIVSVRMYSSVGEILNGFRKNLFKALRDPIRFWSFLVAQFVLFLLPFVLVPLQMNWGGHYLFFLLASATVVFMRILLAARFRMSWAACFLHPVAVGGTIYCALSSWWCIITGHGVSWKGRRYFTAAAARQPAPKPKPAAVPIKAGKMAMIND